MPFASQPHSSAALDQRGATYYVKAFEGRSYKPFICLVRFLDDTEHAFTLDRKSIGSDLLKLVYQHLDLAEIEYFGLKYYENEGSEDSGRWLDAFKSIRKQLKSSTNYLLHLRVRFYVSDPSLLQDDFTRYLFVLQIKKEIQEGRLYIARSIACTLASHLMQSELGDYTSNLDDKDYSSLCTFMPFKDEGFYQEVKQLHSYLKNQSACDSEIAFLGIVADSDMYGIEFHRAFIKGQNSTDIELKVGVSASGIVIFQGYQKISEFSWDQIAKVSFRRRQFSVYLNKDMPYEEYPARLLLMNSKDDTVVHFALPSYRSSKTLWKSCVDHHTFFRLNSLKSHSNKLSFIYRFCSSMPGQFSKGQNDNEKKLLRKTVTSTINSNEKLQNNCDTNCKSSFCSEILDDYRPKKNVLQNVSSSSRMSPSFPSCHSSQTSLYSSLPSPVYRVHSPNYYNDLLLVKLYADENGKFGFNVKGGCDQSSPVLISHVMSNSSADLASPRIREGDEILSINGIEVANLSHRAIINIIKSSKERAKPELVMLLRPSAYLMDDDFLLTMDTNQCENGETLSESIELLRSEMKDNSILQKFEKLYRAKPGYTFDVSKQHENFYKSRYKDVLPYDQTRVILNNGCDTDFINANHVNMPITTADTVNKYIATQGPLPTTCDDFWQMVWEQNISLIIMLTTISENGRVKCHKYWADVGKAMDFGRFKIVTMKDTSGQFVTRREFIFVRMDTKEERKIFQLQCEVWPDHGIPSDYNLFLDFVNEIRRYRNNKPSTVLVHCSAGIGRTGVIILTETSLCLMEHCQPVYPLDIVKAMRDQRYSMVQTKEQFRFACEAILYAYDQKNSSKCST